MNPYLVGYLSVGLLIALTILVIIAVKKVRKMSVGVVLFFMAYVPIWPLLIVTGLVVDILRARGERYCSYCGGVLWEDTKNDHFRYCPNHPMRKLAKAGWAMVHTIQDHPLTMEASMAEIDLKQVLRELDPNEETNR